MTRRASYLSLIGVVTAAALCTLFMAVTAGLHEDVTGELRAELDRSEPTLFTVVARSYDGLFMRTEGLTLEGAAELEKRLDEVAQMAMVSHWRSSGSESVSYQGETRLVKPPVTYVAVSHDYFPMMGLAVSEGRLFTPEEEATGENVCVVGAARPEHLFHWDPRGGMNTMYTVVGHLRPADGYLFPLPTVWSWPSIGEPNYGFPRIDEVVFTPITARAPLENYFYHYPETETWVVPFVAPHPGKYEEARAIVNEFMEAKRPGWALDYGTGSELRLVLENTGRRIAAFFDRIATLLLALFLVSALGFMVLHVTGARQALAVQRAVGASRLQVLVRLVGLALVVSAAGSGLGGLAVLAGRHSLSSYLDQAVTFAPEVVWTSAGLVVLAAVVAALCSGIWATAGLPGETLRRGSLVRGRRLFDVRLPLALAAVALAVCSATSVMLVGRASVESLNAYLRSAGERCIKVEQDYFAASRTLGRADLLGPAHAAALRSALPEEWPVVCQSVLPATVRVEGREPVAAFTYGLDRSWPEGEGFAVERGNLPTWSGSGEQAGALIGRGLAQDLFGDSDPVGQVIDLGGGLEVHVSGVLGARPPGVADPLGDRDRSLVLPHDVLQTLTTGAHAELITELQVFVPEDRDIAEAVETVNRALDRLGSGEIGLAARAVVDETSSLRNLRARVNSIHVILAWLALGVSLLMLAITVQVRLAERRREVGVKRAVGAGPLRTGGELLLGIVGLCLGAALVGTGGGVLLADHICATDGLVRPDALPTLLVVWAAVLVLGLFAAIPPLSLVLGEEPLVSLREGE